MNTVEIIFSPTGGTEKVAHIIRRQWSESTIKIDLSDPESDFSGCAISKESGTGCHAFFWRSGSRHCN